MMLLNRVTTSFYKPLVVIMHLSAAVWPQFATQSFCQHMY